MAEYVDFTEPPWSLNDGKYELDIDPQFCPRCKNKPGDSTKRKFHRLITRADKFCSYWEGTSYEVTFAAYRVNMAVIRRRYLCQAVLPMPGKRLTGHHSEKEGVDYYICKHEWKQELLGMNDKFKITTHLFDWIVGFAEEYERDCHVPTKLHKMSKLSRSRVMRVLEYAKTNK